MTKKATLYRMETNKHTCPFGLRAKDLLKRKGFEVDDKVLETRAEVEEVKSELKVKTTPQVIINEKLMHLYTGRINTCFCTLIIFFPCNKLVRFFDLLN